jgi:hypothetical protein
VRDSYRQSTSCQIMSTVTASPISLAQHPVWNGARLPLDDEQPGSGANSAPALYGLSELENVRESLKSKAADNQAPRSV